MQNYLTDNYGRRMKKLRVSLLDACNFNCSYCMPTHPTFIKNHDLMNAQEIYEIISNLVSLGIEELRLTGGEPTLRPDLIEIMNLLSSLPLKKIGLTTNGTRLKKIIGDIPKNKISTINISLDSLSNENFKAITGRDDLFLVMDSIFSALEHGFNVKLNCVVMKGKNDKEIDQFIKFSSRYGVEVRFLELMKIGVVLPVFDDQFISAQDLISNLQQKYELTKLSDPLDSTSFNFSLNNGARIGFIASESMPFCGNCSRLRLDPKGVLKACLMKNDGLKLRGLPFSEYPEIVKEVISFKPYERIKEIATPMYAIGG